MAFDWKNGINAREMGYQQISSATLAAATALTAPTKDKVNAALIQCEAVAARWRSDGPDPDATTGMLLSPGETLDYTGDLAVLKFIRTAAGSILNVTYYQLDD